MDELFGHLVICDNSYQRTAENQVGNGFAGGDEELITSCEIPRSSSSYRAVEWDLTRIGGFTYGSAIDGIIKEIGTP